MIPINELSLSKDTQIIINVKNKVSLLLILIILSSWCFCVYPQNPSTNFYKSDSIFSFHSQKGYIPSLFTNLGVQVSSPFRLKPRQWLVTGASLGITLALIHVDNEIDDWAKVQKSNHKWVNNTSPVITEFGGNYGIYTVAAIGSLSAIFKNQKGVQTSLLASQSMITSGIWVRLIKLLAGRERPEADYTHSKSEGGKWYGPFVQYDQDLAIKKPGSSFDSFPSGHTATAFSIATVFASQYSNNKVIPVLSYSLASVVGVTRLIEHKHWASDVFVGGLLGYLCGKQVVGNFNKTHQNYLSSIASNSKDKPEVTFIQYGNQVGLSVKF